MALVRFVVVAAALMFVAVSATMNAMFLATLGRSSTEQSLLVGVSLAADIVKAVLPIVVVRAVAMRAWGQAAMSSAMLVVMIVVSLASGTGFAASMRGAAAGRHDAHSREVADVERALVVLDRQIAAVSTARAAAVVEAELAGLKFDRRWSSSKSCTNVSSALRAFCADVQRLRVEQTALTERDALEMRRVEASARVRALREKTGDGDPQATAIAELLGVDLGLPRKLLTAGLAVVLELGCVVLLLIAAGSAVRRSDGTNQHRNQVAPIAAASLDGQAAMPALPVQAPVAAMPRRPAEDHQYWRWLREQSSVETQHPKAGDGAKGRGRRARTASP